RVDNAVPGDTFTLKVKLHNNPPFEKSFEERISIDLDPEDYLVEVTHRTDRVVQVKPPPPAPVDLYEPADVVFRKVPAGLESFSPRADQTESTLSVQGAPRTEIRIQGLGSGLEF